MFFLPLPQAVLEAMVRATMLQTETEGSFTWSVLALLVSQLLHMASMKTSPLKFR